MPTPPPDDWDEWDFDPSPAPRPPGGVTFPCLCAVALVACVCGVVVAALIELFRSAVAGLD